MDKPRLELVESSRCVVTGDMTFATVPGLIGEVGAICMNASEHLDVDLEGVGRADSAGLALLIEWVRSAHRAGKTLSFHGVPSQMSAIARTSDLEGVLPFAE